VIDPGLWSIQRTIGQAGVSVKNRWSDRRAREFVSRYGRKWGKDLSLRTYSSRLIGADEDLVLHGGGNSSVKGRYRNILGEAVPAIFVKASGFDLARIEPEGHPAVDLDYLRRLRRLPECSDEEMAEELRSHLLDSRAPMPSIETLLHAFLPPKFIDHTHADSILALTNRPGGEQAVREALGDEVIYVGYVRPGFPVAKAAAEAFEENPDCSGIVLARHGLVTWGETARESYDATIELVRRAERYLARRRFVIPAGRGRSTVASAEKRFRTVAPVLRGVLALPTGNEDWPYERFILAPIRSAWLMRFLDSARGKRIALSPPLTSDHLIRIKPFPLWIDKPRYDDPRKLRQQLSRAIGRYAERYQAYFQRHAYELEPGAKPFDPRPRVIFMPGLGVVCTGRDATEARIAGDITVHTLRVKMKIAAFGRYGGLSEAELFDMEYMKLQREKLGRMQGLPLCGCVALVTGAAGAIGSAICEELLKHGCHVAVTDLDMKAVDSLVKELAVNHADRVIGVGLDVTDPGSVSRAFGKVIATWGGIDLVVANAGLAHASPLAEMDIAAFRKLERVNTEGVLNTISEAARLFKMQRTAGDIILVSTKNVFSPGAGFGAYSSTKAAAHQLARIASLELAEIGVRVNAVSPDAVFRHGTRSSGLWAEVGPDRMKARGLDQEGLEDYYRNRNLLKARVTATHVARAVLFFATHQTPTTGATIPVDGGLPDATPR